MHRILATAEYAEGVVDLFEGIPIDSHISGSSCRDQRQEVEGANNAPVLQPDLVFSDAAGDPFQYEELTTTLTSTGYLSYLKTSVTAGPATQT